MKTTIIVATVIATIALGACRREEAAPLKLGGPMPAASQIAR